jgi:hypothetical protein
MGILCILVLGLVLGLMLELMLGGARPCPTAKTSTRDEENP